MELTILKSIPRKTTTPKDTHINNGELEVSFEDIINESISKSSSLPYIPPKGTEKTTWFKWYGEVYLESEHWKKTRSHVLQRDEHRCRFCGCSATKTNPLEVHHRDYDHLYREHEHDAVLVTLCKRCHRGMHRIKRNG